MTDNFLYDFSFGNNSLICKTSVLVSLHKLDFSPLTPILSPVLNACRWFSAVVHHSKFSTLLSCFTPFLWFINGLLSGFGIKEMATHLCRGTDFSKPFESVRSTLMYPYFVGLGFKNLDNRLLQILPNEDTSYSPMYPSTSENISFFIKKILPLNLKNCGRSFKNKGAINVINSFYHKRFISKYNIL